MSGKRTHLSMNPFETTIVNVYEIETKKIVFTGAEKDVAKFLGIDAKSIPTAIKRKYKVKDKKYTLRHVRIKDKI